MSRDMSVAMSLGVVEQKISPIILMDLEFESGHARFWTGVGNLVWDGVTWVGQGNLLGLSQVDETRDVQGSAMSMSLSGQNPALVSAVYNDFSQGRPVINYLGLMDASGQIVIDPVTVFAGRLDTISDEDDGSSATITVSAISDFADLKRVRARFFTDQDQQRIKPGDRSFRFMPTLQDKQVFWGVREGSPPLSAQTF